jgi:predicted dehydrogenase
MNRIRTAVIGVGYLGAFHAQKYAMLEDSVLVGVVDTNGERVQQVAAELSTEAFRDYRDLLSRVDAVSIAVPTIHHHSVAKDCLEAGVHILLEKPVTKTVEEAENLIQIAHDRNLVFQAGHLERFNPAVLAMREIVQNPYRSAWHPSGAGVPM